MNTETRNCQNCKQDFTIEPEDFNFYEKIKVPPPTFCPECRRMRRFAQTNEVVLYKRKCDLTGKDIFSMYPPDTLFPVYETDEWYSDKWDPYEYGIDFDENKPFLEQFLELQNKVPRMSLVKQGECVNSPYTHRVSGPKNSFMVFRSSYPEDCLYEYNGKYSKNCVDCSWVFDSQICYECVNIKNCYNLKFSQESNDCRDSFFLYACRNCSDCVGCVNLVNKQYCIWNKQYTKEEYEKLVEKIKKHMDEMPYVDKKGRVYKYGEFFPIKHSQFGYNNSTAIQHFKMTKQEALENDYPWIEIPHGEYKITKKISELNDSIKDINEDILKEVIECENCKNPYRILENEFLFYKKENIPIPTMCHDCRFERRIKDRLSLKLYERSCMCNGEKDNTGVYKNTTKHFHGDKKCEEVFKTGHNPEKKEIVYCEKCYQQEVY